MYYRKIAAVAVVLISLGIILGSWGNMLPITPVEKATDSIRALYERPVSSWPKPNVDAGAVFAEFAPLPDDSTWKLVAQDAKVGLGQLLFFDPRLSRSNQISCSSCHDPDLSWQDGRVVSLGNEHLQGSRNTPSLLNSFILKKLFWDGRAMSYDEQASSPIGAHHEMDMDIKMLAVKIAGIKGYVPLFNKAYGSNTITLTKITQAIASFEKTIRSRKTRFDYFMLGNYKILNDAEVRGLHLFRTKARCMNCHNGTYLTDTGFHNIGLTYYKRKYEDLGRYNITKNIEDIGRFKTPSLREVMRTRPWMHNGLFDDITGVINIYNSGMPQLPKTADQKQDPYFPKTDKLLQPLHLTAEEKQDIVAFLNTVTGVPYRMRRPELPK